MLRRRRSDWPKQLEKYFRECQGKSFALGGVTENTHDCALFALGAIRAMTGVELSNLHGLREHYQAHAQERDLLAAVREFAARNGIPELPPLYATQGDVVMVEEQPGRLLLGVVALDGWRVWTPGKSGLEIATLRMARNAWGIGRRTPNG